MSLRWKIVYNKEEICQYFRILIFVLFNESHSLINKAKITSKKIGSYFEFLKNPKSDNTAERDGKRHEVLDM